MGRPRASFLAILLTFALASPVAHAGIMDAVKQKAKEKTETKATDATDKAMGDAEKAATDKKDKAAGSEQSSAEKPVGESRTGAGVSAGKISAVSTKFDFVPGDSVLFLDDFTQDELGEFPQRWKLQGGTFEVAEMEGKRWLRCVSEDGHIRMKAPSLPELWTLEFDFYDAEGTSNGLTVTGLAKDENEAWSATFPTNGADLALRSGDVSSTTALEGSEIPGRHHVMLLGRGAALKAYVDQERLGSMPDVTGHGVAAEFDIRLWSGSKPMITNVRFAQGPRPPKDMLAGGKLVTHGILFETGSDVVLPESAPVLRQIAAYMEANPAVRLKITGHTDNVGQASANLDLSKRRAASVAKVFSTQFMVGAARFQTDGKGDTQPVSSNAKPEGRAMNRRVEFAKL
jgi:OmpA-OmpF porin, OOP family